MFWTGHVYQILTYMFLHGSFGHIFFNMLILWMIGTPLEATWGPKRFLKYYLITGLGAGVINALVMPASMIPTVGASGAIYGLLLAFGVMFPNQMIFLWFVIPIRAKYLVIILGVAELFFGISGTQSGVAHFAHLGGLLVGLVYLKWGDWTRAFKRRKADTEAKKHLKVVYDRRQEREKLQKEIDDLLDKINRNGIDSLSPREVNRLKEASRKLKEWEQQEG
jgi:membrane associated rhomboid family serine protease